MNIHVGNLAREVTEKQLREAFEPFGQVATVKIITDRHSGVGKGFAFVEIEDQAEAQAAIDGLNRKEFEGRTLDLSEARPFSQGRRNSKPYGGARGGGPGRGQGGGSSGGRKRRSF